MKFETTNVFNTFNLIFLSNLGLHY